MTSTFHYNGMTHEYDNDTRFIVQTGRYKNAYQTRSVRTGDYQESIEMYEALRVTQGYKKRLIMIRDIHNQKEITLARYLSERG